MNPQQIIKILLKLKLKNFTNFIKIKPNKKRRNICLRKQIRVEFCHVHAIKQFVTLSETVLGINPEGAIFESFQITNSKKKVGTSTWRTIK